MDAASQQIHDARSPGLYDVEVVNDDLERAAAEVSRLIAPSALARPRVVFILGGPGSGKGTQSARLVDRFGFTHLSAGDLLRAEVDASDSPESAIISECMAEGKIVPVDITCRLLRKAMAQTMLSTHPSPDPAGQQAKAQRQAAAGTSGVFLIDGFPRNMENLEGWRREMMAAQQAETDADGLAPSVSFVLVLDCPQPVMQHRLLQRGLTSGRVDDNLAAIQKRFGVFESETMPVLHLLRGEGLVHDIAGDRTEDDVFADIEALFLALLPPVAL